MKAFYAVLANTVAASMANTYVWFAVTFWVYLQTQSVIATSVMAGVYTITVAGSGFFLGSLVDRFSKKHVMLVSSLASLVLFACAWVVYVANPAEVFNDPGHPALWLFIVLTLMGALAGNVRGIALSTLVTVWVPEPDRDRANGLVGSANGAAFLVASIFSGLAIGYIGVSWMLILAVALTVAVILHLLTIRIDVSEPKPAATAPEGTASTSMVDLSGTIRIVRLVPGLFGLIFFHTFNNFLGGVFMSLMDAYGLQLVSVQVWGVLWGFLSLGFIVGGMVVARRGLGANPLRTLFLGNIVMWVICSLFTLLRSIELLTVGMFIWLCLIPAVEAAEQTILQKVVPADRQGRVFGFAQSVEQAATPITAFLIGPIAQWFFIPFMTTGMGVDLIGSWFGTGTDRGLALLFTLSGVIGLIVTILAMRTYAYRSLSAAYRSDQAQRSEPQPA